MNLGDINTSQVLYFHFTTRQFSTGTPITSASLVVSVYKDDSTTESTSGITTTFSGGFDGNAGLVSVKIDTSSNGTFYAAGHDFSVVITAGTADSVSIISEVVGYFSIQNRSALRPTTAGRTLVVDASGLADANTVKVGPTGSGTAQTARDLGASVLLSSGSGTGQITLSSGAVTVGTNNDKTGYTVSTVSDKTGYSLSSLGIQAIWDALTSALTTVGSIGKLIVTNLDALISSRMATYTQPTGFLAATFPTTVASTTNITAGTITTATNLTNAPTAGDFTTAMKTSLNNATPAVTVSDKTGFSLVAGYDPAKTAAQAGDAMTLTAAYDAAKTAAQVGSVMKVDSGTGANQVDLTSGKVNVGKMNDATLLGIGAPGDLWRGT